MIKAIIFDWGGVLIHDPEDSLMVYCANKLGLEVNIFKKKYYQYQKDFHKNKITEMELWKKICKELGVSAPKPGSIWQKAVKKIFKENKSVIEIARKLKSNGYLIGLLSDADITAVEYFKKQKYNIFNVSVFSCIERYVKPEKEIYEIILNRLDTLPGETIFIDDKKIHVEGAKKLGINTILFTTAENLIKEFLKFGVNLG